MNTGKVLLDIARKSNNKKIVFPEIRDKKFNSDYTLFEITADATGYNHFFGLDTMCEMMLQSGLIDEYNLEEGILVVNGYDFTRGEEIVVEREYDMLDFISELSLEDCGRVLKCFLDQDLEGIMDDLPF